MSVIHRYLLAGAARDALDGKDIIIVAQRKDIRGIMKELEMMLPDDTRITRTHAQRMDIPGAGWVVFRSTDSNSLRGYSANVAILPRWSSSRLYLDATVCINDRQGELVQYGDDA